MAMVGHKTESIYRRYAITDEAMLKEGAAKLAALHEVQRSAVAKTAHPKPERPQPARLIARLPLGRWKSRLKRR